jgi:hypothetical protein
MYYALHNRVLSLTKYSVGIEGRKSEDIPFYNTNKPNDRQFEFGQLLFRKFYLYEAEQFYKIWPPE